MKPDPIALIEAFGRGLAQGLIGANAETPAPQPRRKPAPRAQNQQPLPFEAPAVFGGPGRSMFEPPNAPAPTADELQMQFGSLLTPRAQDPLDGDPRAAAYQLDEAATSFGVRRPAQADPPGTYRPGEEENKSWMAPQIPPSPTR